MGEIIIFLPRLENYQFSMGRNDNFLTKAKKLSVLPTELDIFDIQQQYIHILYIRWQSIAHRNSRKAWIGAPAECSITEVLTE